MHLPRYLAVMQAETVATASSIDSELVSEVAALGFDREFITESIRHRVQVPRPRLPSSMSHHVSVGVCSVVKAGGRRNAFVTYPFAVVARVFHAFMSHRSSGRASTHRRQVKGLRSRIMVPWCRTRRAWRTSSCSTTRCA